MRTCFEKDDPILYHPSFLTNIRRYSHPPLNPTTLTSSTHTTLHFPFLLITFPHFTPLSYSLLFLIAFPFLNHYFSSLHSHFFLTTFPHCTPFFTFYLPQSLSPYLPFSPLLLLVNLIPTIPFTQKKKPAFLSKLLKIDHMFGIMKKREQMFLIYLKENYYGNFKFVIRAIS
jgi:hypothetical protein